MSHVAVARPFARSRSSAAANECATRLVGVGPLVVRFIRTRMRRQMPGLTIAQFRAMSFLYRARGCSLRALADHLGVTPPTCSALVERLVTQGAATRTPDAANRRRVALRLTRAGRARFEAATAAARRQTAAVLASLSEAELRRLAHDLDVLAAAFTDTEVTPDR